MIQFQQSFAAVANIEHKVHILRKCYTIMYNLVFNLQTGMPRISYKLAQWFFMYYIDLHVQKTAPVQFFNHVKHRIQVILSGMHIRLRIC